MIAHFKRSAKSLSVLKQHQEDAERARYVPQRATYLAHLAAFRRGEIPQEPVPPEPAARSLGVKTLSNTRWNSMYLVPLFFAPSVILSPFISSPPLHPLLHC